MFGLFSLSSIALAVLYVWGVVMMSKAGRNAGKSWLASVSWALAWPVTAWKLINDLWRTQPPSEEEPEQPQEGQN